MLFDFQTFILELKDNSEKKETIQKYEQYYGEIEGDISKQIWFVDYISKFFPYYETANCPDELQDDFDWQLLFSLLLGSFSSQIELIKPDRLLYDLKQKVDIYIYVTSNGQTIKKCLNELWGFQILRLYEIYCEEQINLQILIAEDEREMQAIYNQRLSKFNFIKNYSSTNRIRGIFDNKVNEFENRDLIYHYTSFNTLNEILKSNSLRACDLKRLNDKMEYKIWFEIFEQSVEKYSVKEDVNLFSDFLDKVASKINEYKKYDVYVTCLSKERDLLSQWRAYGDDGQGIAIAFDISELLDNLYEFNQGDFNLLNGFLEYNYDIVFKDLNDMIGEILRNYVSTNLTVDEYFNRVDNLKYFDEKTESIFMRMQDLKDSSFFEEKEFRIFWQQYKENAIKEVSTFERNKRIIPFVNLSFGSKKLPIKEIILGPSLTEKEEKIENIIAVLDCYNYDINSIKITKSKLPYRK